MAFPTPLLRWFFLVCPALLLMPRAIAQSVVPAQDGTHTQTHQQGQRIDISGGQRSGDGTNLFHSFERFGLTREEVANFQSSPELQNILVRVIGGDASVIDGLLQMSGGHSNLFLMNPAGILFGQNVRLDLPAAFTATTANGIGLEGGWFNAIGENDYAALIGQPTNFAFSLGQSGAIANAGNLTVAPGQSLNLIGNTVTNTGQLNAPSGQVTVTAVPGSSRVRLSQPGSPLSIEVAVSNASRNGNRSSTLPELLTGGSLPSATELMVTNGTAQISGSINAGTVAVVGDRVNLSNATINASSPTGGGTVLIGGDLRGQGAIPNAITTIVNANTTIHADALNQGDGGQVILWSEQATTFAGRITARGGVNGGNGGFVEVSGREHLAFDGLVNTEATLGESGTLLLDPRNIIISDAPQFSLPSEDSLFTLSDLLLLTGKVIFEATNNITVDAGLNVIFPTDEPGATIRFVADSDRTGGGSFTMGTGSQITTNGRPLEISAASISAEDINTSGDKAGALQAGGVTLSAQGEGSSPGNIRVGDIDLSDRLSAGDVTIRSTSSIPGNISIGSINAQSLLGRGGSVVISGDLVEIGTIPTIPNVSISTVGNIISSSSGGDISITHGGGADNIPFTVRSNRINQNGTVGRIEAGTGGSIGLQGSAGTTFAVAPNDDRSTPTSGITIFSFNDAPNLTVTPNSQTFSIIGNTSVTINISEKLNSSDRNGDNTAFIISDLLSGSRLTRNGVLLANGSVVSRGEALEYTPPANQDPGSNTLAFRILAADFNAGTPSLSQSNNSYPVFVRVTSPSNPTEPSQTPPITPPITPPTTPPIPLPSVPSTSQLTPSDVPAPILNIEPLSLPTVAAIGENTALGTDITTLEESASEDFTAYLGLGDTVIKSPEQARNIAQGIEQATGAKPALIYINFVSSNTSLLGEPQQPEADDLLEITIVSAKGMIRQRVPNVTRSQFSAVAQTFRSKVTDPRLTFTKSYLPAAQQLYQWLIAPIAPQLAEQKISNLVFIPDAGLRSLPYAALHDGQQFLVEQYSIGLMPSLSLTNTSYTDIHNSQVLAMGISESTQGEAPLPAVPTEVSTLMDLWRRRGATFFNQQATLENLQQTREAKPYGIIHMATHANFVAGATDNSYIQLWNERLKINQIRQLGWNDPPVEMLVLSACRTALGDAESELGFAGLAVQAGVKTVVASLWYVSDSATTGLMTKFYEQLNTAPIKADALRQAQIAMARGEVYIKDGYLHGVEGLDRAFGSAIVLPANLSSDQDFTHPYYWASFTMVGNPW
jgi:filamentous hemagglutinin family protein